MKWGLEIEPLAAPFNLNVCTLHPITGRKHGGLLSDNLSLSMFFFLISKQNHNIDLDICNKVQAIQVGDFSN